MDWEDCVAGGVGPENEGRKRWDQDLRVSTGFEIGRIFGRLEGWKGAPLDCMTGGGCGVRGVSCVGENSSI